MTVSVTVHGEFMKALKEAARQISTSMATGNMESYSDYREACGVVRGLNEAFSIYDDVIQQISEQENE